LSTFLVARQNIHSDAAPAVRTSDDGNVGISRPLGRIGKWCSVASGMS
jgi:hypothetical protein